MHCWVSGWENTGNRFHVVMALGQIISWPMDLHSVNSRSVMALNRVRSPAETARYSRSESISVYPAWVGIGTWCILYTSRKAPLALAIRSSFSVRVAELINDPKELVGEDG